MRKLANQLVHFWRRSEGGSIGPIVQSSEHIEDGRRHFEHHWMLRTGRNGDRKLRIALDHGDFLRIVFDNRPDVVSATQKNEIKMPTDNVTLRSSAGRWLVLGGADADAGPCEGEFAGRHILQI